MSDSFNKHHISINSFISIFYRIGVAYLSQRYETYQIGYGQYQFLLALYFADGLSQDELTKRIAVDKATTTRSITRLKEHDYVTVTIDENDKRVHRVWLTPKAHALQKEIFTIAAEWEAKFLHSLTQEEISTMRNLFYKIAISNEWLTEEKGIIDQIKF